MILKKAAAVFLLVCWAAPGLGAFEEVTVQDVHLKDHPPFEYRVSGKVINQTAEPREVVLRAQALLFDASAPKGDLPVHAYRKDMTIVLKPSETREVEAVFVKEGKFPDLRARIEPVLRIRRQRLWMNRYEDIELKKS